VLLAATFAFRWGLRAPASLVLFPMWVGSGLLGTVVVATPLSLLAGAVSGEALVADAPDIPVEPWVYGIVYTGFALQGVALLTAFLLYARARWPAAFHGRVGRSPGPTRSGLRALLVPLTDASAVGASAVAALHLLWAAGWNVGLTDASAAERSVTGQVNDAVTAAFVLAAVLGLLALVRGWGASLPRWSASVSAWLGSGAMFGWGLWTTTVFLLGGAGLGDGSAGELVGVVGLARFALGIVMGMVLVVTLAPATASPCACASSGTACAYGPSSGRWPT
jgi:hypothetical protein